MAVYLDYNATTPLRQQAADAMSAWMTGPGNPSSVHRFGRTARSALEGARAQVARAIGADPATLIFTSGATEANLMALTRCGRSRVLISALEHDSVRAAAPDAEIIPATPEGIIDLGALERLLTQGEGAETLVSVMMVNNELGTIQPVAEAVHIARQAGALIHCDAAQALGKIPVDMAALGVDLLTLSAHKCGGPAGVGAMIHHPACPPQPLIVGGGQERRLRAGTENLIGILGFGAAAEAAVVEIEQFQALSGWRDRIEAAVRAAGGEALATGGPRVANTTALVLPGMSAETQVIRLDIAGFAVSAGSACSSGKVQASPVVRALGRSEADAGSTIRVSLGWQTRETEVDGFIEAWTAMARRQKLLADALPLT